MLIRTNSNRCNEFVKDRLLVYLKKNKDYGDSFLQSLLKFGEVSAYVRIEDKVNRYISLYGSIEGAEVEDESIKDTLLDLFNYSMMFRAYKEDGARIQINDLANVMMEEATIIFYADKQGADLEETFIYEVLNEKLEIAEMVSKGILLDIKQLINLQN